MIHFHASIQQAPVAAQRTCALDYAKAIFSQDPGVQLRLMTFNHPDFILLAPLADKTVLSIDQVRACLSTLSLLPYEGDIRLVALLQADQMSEQAQNCLLKTLESPPQSTAFLLLCEQPGALLPTIHSRCTLLRAQDTPTQDALETAKAFLKGAEENAAALADAFPRERPAALAHCITLLDGLDALLTLTPGPRARARMAQGISLVQQAYEMLLRNVNVRACAEWLCIQMKEAFHDDSRRH